MSEKIVIIFAERLKIGLTATPYFASIEPHQSIVTLHEQVSVERLKNSNVEATEIERQMIKSLDEISDKRLHAKFSKEKSIKLFYDKLNAEMLETRVRPEIEKRMTQCLTYLSLSPETPAFYKSTSYSQLYISDRISIPILPAETLFKFNLTPDGLEYTLRIVDGDGSFGLLKRDVQYLTHTPCSFLLNNKLYRFTDIDSKKLKPFFEKSVIKIALPSVKSYFEKFVLNCIRDYKVEAEGFEIVDKTGKPRAILSLENNLDLQPVLSLKYNYSEQSYLAGTKSNVFVKLAKSSPNYVFHKIERDIEWEKSIEQKLAELGLTPVTDCLYRPATSNNINLNTQLYNIINWLIKKTDELKNNNIEIVQSVLLKKYHISPFNFNTQVTKENDWFELDAFIEIGEFKIPFIKLKKHIQNGTREFELPDQTFFIIPEEWFSKYSEILHFAKVDEEDKLRIDKVFFNLLTNAGLGTFEEESLLTLQGDFDLDIHSIETPLSLKAELRPYQKQGFSWLYYLSKNQVGGILADDMGLGKTIQTIALLLHHYIENQPEGNHSAESMKQLSLFGDTSIAGFNQSNLPPSLIAMPTSLVHNWSNEIQHFAPDLKIYVYTGQNRLKTKDIAKILRHYHVVITSYGVIRNDINYLKEVDFLYLILDESQYIKNPTSKIYESVMELKGKHRLILTGTPIENSLNDLWAQMNFVNKGVLGTLNYFKNHFSNPISKDHNEEIEKRLQTLISPFILRRTKNMVAKDLPPITEQTVYCDMSPEQKKVYEKEKSGIRNELLKIIQEQGIEKTSMMTLRALTRMRQLANHPVLVDSSFKGTSGKFEQIMEHIDNVVTEKHKVLIFSSFVKDLELIEKELIANKMQYSKLTGQTTNREEVINNFSKNDDCRIFLISLKAGGVGLNLTEADYVFMLNPWWNPAAELQAINRAHRIGQTKNVFVYRFISTDTIEEKIAKLQEKKLTLADAFINSNNPFKNMTENQIKELFA